MCNFLGISEYCEQDERIIDNAIEENVFFTLREVILKSSVFHKEVHFTLGRGGQMPIYSHSLFT